MGGGPAGASAALAALAEGADVKLVEKSRFPRHKVCGEFLSPGLAAALDRENVWSRCQAAEPVLIRRMALHFRKTSKIASLPETAYGLSRYAFDSALLESATARGARIVMESLEAAKITATGRGSKEPKGRRLFGFKAHFAGACDDAVELFFFDGFYVGINCVEGKATNICGLGPEDRLREIGFGVDELLWQNARLRNRIAPLTRTMPWMFTGPLVFGNRLHQPPADVFHAGDALSFVDPFTGSGLTCAVLTGLLAGRYAAVGRSVSEYLRACQQVIGQPFGVSTVLRSLASTPMAPYLAGLVPSSALFRFTRPRAIR